MTALTGIRNLLSLQVLLTLLCSVECCNYGPGNLGLFNYGAGNIGFFNYGVANAGVGNKGFLNGGLLNTGFTQLGLRNIGAFNVAPIPNTISVFNVPVGLNLTPPISVPGRRRRRRSTMKHTAKTFGHWRAKFAVQIN